MQKKTEKWAKYYITICLAMLFLGIAICAAGQIWRITKERQSAMQEYDFIRKEYNPIAVMQEEKQTALMDINSDYVGWIQIHNINVEYPIVKGADNDKYLHITFEGEENSAGCIFMDYRNNSDFSGKHTILYGHRMKNGTMFGNLHDYLDEIYRKENAIITISMPNGKQYRYCVIGARISDAWDFAYQVEFSDDTEFLSLLEKVGAPLTSTNLLTLSTCASRGDNDERILVHAVLEEIIDFPA